ncbi:MAG: hypothetical protein WAV25_00350 [Minisyncoccia bacterium]
MDFYKPRNRIEEALRVIQEEKNVPKEQIASKPNNPFRIIKPTLILLSLFLIVGFVAYVGYWGVSTIDYNKASVTGNMIANINKYGKIPLPTDEQPTIVTVSNLEPLQSQPIFKNARVGDTLLIYTKARRAILYRPSEKGDKAIIEDATLVD